MSDPTRLQGTNPLLRSAESAPVHRGAVTPDATRNAGTEGPSFAEVLRARQGIAPIGAPTAGNVRFSAHAQTRLQSRQIPLEAAHLDRLQGAVQRAASKGARDALVLMDDMAMVVSIANRTVITVVDKDNLKQNVFTNIDSAVIA